MIGDDVLQLEQALVALGYDDDGNLEPDDTFAYETTRAVRAFQADLGLEQDGVLELGEIVFLPGPAQVLEQFSCSRRSSHGTRCGDVASPPAMPRLGGMYGNSRKPDRPGLRCGWHAASQRYFYPRNHPGRARISDRNWAGDRRGG